MIQKTPNLEELLDGGRTLRRRAEDLDEGIAKLRLESCLLRKIGHFARLLLAGPPAYEDLQQRVYRLKGTNDLSGSWGHKIVELGDGRSVQDVVTILYREELTAGAGLVDIGLWKNLFDRSVVLSIMDLADRGYICLNTGQEEPTSNLPGIANQWLSPGSSATTASGYTAHLNE